MQFHSFAAVFICMLTFPSLFFLRSPSSLCFQDFHTAFFLIDTINSELTCLPTPNHDYSLWFKTWHRWSSAAIRENFKALIHSWCLLFEKWFCLLYEKGFTLSISCVLHQSFWSTSLILPVLLRSHFDVGWRKWSFSRARRFPFAYCSLRSPFPMHCKCVSDEDDPLLSTFGVFYQKVWFNCCINNSLFLLWTHCVKHWARLPPLNAGHNISEFLN